MKRFGWFQLVFALVVGFAAGAAVGLHAHRWMMQRMHSGHMIPRIVQRLGRELQLSDDQRQKLTGILTRTHDRLEALREEAHKKFEGALDTSAGEIEKILTPDQVAKFKALRAKWEARRKTWGRGPDSV